MVCKFRASMRNTSSCSAKAVLVSFLLALACVAQAEKADRAKPLKVEADSPSKIDIAKQVVTFNGNVVVTKGTMTIRAERIEVRETPDGHHVALATGIATKPAMLPAKARWRRRVRSRAEADRLEYDSRADVVRFVGNAQVRRLRGASVADEVSGASITYDNAAEVFSCRRRHAAESGAACGPSSCRAESAASAPAVPSDSADERSCPPSPRASDSRLEAEGLQKTYGARKVVKDVHLAVGAGEVVGLLGPNGAGKTTSFYMIVGLVRADAGEIRIDGATGRSGCRSISARDWACRYLPQEASIFRKLTVAGEHPRGARAAVRR